MIFGADRLSANGDANIGVWFFQQSVVPNGSGGFTGAHQDHDLFVISAFTNGGGASNISVYEWDGSCKSGVKNPQPGQCADANLKVLAIALPGVAPGVCNSSSPYCGITNSATTSATWATGGSLASPLLFAGGVDMTAAFAAVNISQLPCFSSFLVETRSSQSTSAVLKDFQAGGFPVCGLSVTKACGTPTVDSTGTSVTFPVNGIVRNIGAGTLYNVTVLDTIGSQTPAATCSAPGCQTITVVNNTPNSIYSGGSTLAPGETGTWSGSTSSASLSQQDVAIAKGASVSGSTTLDVTSVTPAPQTCSTSISTSLTVTKSCSTSLGGSAQVVVGFSGQVCNIGSSQVTGVGLTDFVSTSTSGTSVASGLTLAPGACTSYSGSYTPTHYDSAASGGTGPGRYFFNDLIAITGSPTATLGGPLTPLANQTDARCNGTYGCAPASCPLCQGQGANGQCAP